MSDWEAMEFFNEGILPRKVSLKQSTCYIMTFWCRKYNSKCLACVVDVIHSYCMADLILSKEDEKSKSKTYYYTAQDNIHLLFGRVHIGPHCCLTIDRKYDYNKFQCLIIECDEMIIEKDGSIHVTGCGYVRADDYSPMEIIREFRCDNFDSPSSGLVTDQGCSGGGIIHLMIHKHFENKGYIEAAGSDSNDKCTDGGDGGYVLLQTRNRKVLKKRGFIDVNGGWAPNHCCASSGDAGIVHIETHFNFNKPVKYLLYEDNVIDESQHE